MAFIQASAPIGQRDGRSLSADNGTPDRHIVIETLRNASSLMGLSPSVIATLDAMLSCLPPKRTHNTVFASNATLTFRRNGISDRTLRRHAATLQDLGLLVRHDSPNGKRFTRHSRDTGMALRFGFDLTPLFNRLHDIARLAAQALQAQEQLAYLRSKLRAAVNDTLRTDPDDTTAQQLRQALRRKLSIADCETMLHQLALDTLPAEAPDDTPGPAETAPMAARNGQNVRHHHSSNKENIDKKENRLSVTSADTPCSTPVSVPELLSACPEALDFSLRKIETSQDVIAHARTLAPMMGIDSKTYQAADDRLGAYGTAMTIWAMLQFQGRIQRAGAYFRAITSGSKSAGFDPGALVRRLATAGIVRGQHAAQSG